MTLLADLTRTRWLLLAGQPLDQIARDARAKETPMRPERHDPIAVPLSHADRQRIAVLTDPRDVIDDSPTCARTVGAEAYRRQVDSVALDPSHGIAQSASIEAARRREIIASIAAALRATGAVTEAAIDPMAYLVWHQLDKDGVL